MQDGTPHIDPTYEVEVIRGIRLSLCDIKDGFVQDSDGSYSDTLQSVNLETKTILPVTPAMVRGCAPKTEKIKEAMKDEMSTSETPYFSVVSMRSNEKAIPGRTLRRL
jgi:hypothetical protein